uniref:(northern house mosquito) hypothetical protein n=1 Tax=Culex pipiens TaxID=7175 RepID=A0A8D8C314_CULPI
MVTEIVDFGCKVEVFEAGLLIRSRKIVPGFVVVVAVAEQQVVDNWTTVPTYCSCCSSSCCRIEFGVGLAVAVCAVALCNRDGGVVEARFEYCWFAGSFGVVD